MPVKCLPTARAALASTVLVTALAGCASMAQHATTSAASASASAGASTATPSQATCLELVSWNQRGASAVKALYADTGALTADARANNAKAVAAAGSKLTSDAIAAATLPVPPVAGASWKTLTAAYAAAGTALGQRRRDRRRAQAAGGQQRDQRVLHRDRAVQLSQHRLLRLGS